MQAHVDTAARHRSDVGPVAGRTTGGKTAPMALTTRFTDLFGVQHPIALAPMGGSAGGGLAAAVSNGGGLGLIGVGRGDAEWMDREAALAAAATSKPWGIGFKAGPRK